MRLPRPSFRRPSLPAEVRAELALERGERLLSWAPLASGGHAVATDRALVILRGADRQRVAWWQVTSATWDDQAQQIVLTALTEQGPQAVTLPVPERTPLPETVRERVQSSIVVSQHVPLRGSAGVRVVGRRVPGQADVLWQMVLDRGLDPTDEQVRALAQDAVERVRRETVG